MLLRPSRLTRTCRRPSRPWLLFPYPAISPEVPARRDPLCYDIGSSCPAHLQRSRTRRATAGRRLGTRDDREGRTGCPSRDDRASPGGVERFRSPSDARLTPVEAYVRWAARSCLHRALYGSIASHFNSSYGPVLSCSLDNLRPEASDPRGPRRGPCTEPVEVRSCRGRLPPTLPRPRVRRKPKAGLITTGLSRSLQYPFCLDRYSAQAFPGVHGG
jgi:hypothetical protein